MVKTRRDKPITESEMLKSIKNLSSGKTPGFDGLAADFYKFFWCDIKNLLTQCIIYVMAKGLLNTDYNVIAKILATRLQAVLPKNYQ